MPVPDDPQQHRGRYRSKVPERLLVPSDSESFSDLQIAILHTTTHGTMDALQEAARLADGLLARIQIVVAYVVPYPLPIDEARVDPAFRLRDLIDLCEKQPIKTQINIWLCRDFCQCIHEGLPPNSLVVIGGRQSWWPFAYEKRLARKVRRAGHQVVFFSSH